MTPEFTALALAGLLLVQFLHLSVLANLELGSRYFTSPRDRAPDRELSLRTTWSQLARDDHPSQLGRSGVTICGPRASSPGSRWG
jgi:hypothetical protein